jgi:hypothetical protein
MMFLGKNQRVRGALRSWPMSFGFFFFSFVSSVNITDKYNIREPKVKEIGKDKKEQLTS